MTQDELTKALKEKGLVIGSNNVISRLRNGKLKKVFVSKNCEDKLEKDINHYAKVFKIEVIKLDKNNEELGAMCKKPFSISVLGY